MVCHDRPAGVNSESVNVSLGPAQTPPLNGRGRGRSSYETKRILANGKKDLRLGVVERICFPVIKGKLFLPPERVADSGILVGINRGRGQEPRLT